MNTCNHPIRIACIGEAMVELTGIAGSTDKVALGFAGDTLNTAIYLKRLFGADADIAYLTKLGHDTFSNRLSDFIAAESIDTRFIERSPDRLVGLYAIDTDAAGERTFSYWRSQSAARTLFQCASGELRFAALDNFDVLYLSAITLAILPAPVREALMQALHSRRSAGAIVAFDSNYRPALWESQRQAQLAIANAWRHTDIALPSIDDEVELFGDAGEREVRERLHGYGIRRGALKRGALGPLSLDPAADSTRAAAHQAIQMVVDSTAAGDSFNAGFLCRTLTGGSDAEALAAGHQLAMRVLGYPGAIIPATQW